MALCHAISKEKKAILIPLFRLRWIEKGKLKKGNEKCKWRKVGVVGEEVKRSKEKQDRTVRYGKVFSVRIPVSNLIHTIICNVSEYINVITMSSFSSTLTFLCVLYSLYAVCIYVCLYTVCYFCFLLYSIAFFYYSVYWKYDDDDGDSDEWIQGVHNR